jgi:hypothetical protein
VTSREPKPRSMAAVTIGLDHCSSENKSGCMLGTPSIPPYSPIRVTVGSDNLWVRAISRKDSDSRLDADTVPSAVGWYLAGFTDGEGSFNVSFRPRGDYVFPWKVSLCFNISQRERTVLDLVQRTLGCGTMRQRSDGVWYFEVNHLDEILCRVVPFFEHFGFLSAKKQRDFAKFKELALLLAAGQHLTREGVAEVLRIRRDMNDGGKRRYVDDEILSRFENPQRPYARRSARAKRWSDLHGDMQSATEMIAPLL